MKAHSNLQNAPGKRFLKNKQQQYNCACYGLLQLLAHASVQRTKGNDWNLHSNIFTAYCKILLLYQRQQLIRDTLPVISEPIPNPVKCHARDISREAPVISEPNKGLQSGLWRQQVSITTGTANKFIHRDKHIVIVPGMPHYTISAFQ